MVKNCAVVEFKKETAMAYDRVQVNAGNIFLQVYSQDSDIVYQGGQDEYFRIIDEKGQKGLIRHIINTQYNSEEKREISAFIKAQIKEHAESSERLYRIFYIDSYDLSDWEDNSVPGERGIIALLKFAAQELDKG